MPDGTGAGAPLMTGSARRRWPPDDGTILHAMTTAPDASMPAPRPAPPGRHLPVLLQETLELLNPAPGETALDCTAGLGGHAQAIAERIGKTGTLVLCDLDAGNLQAATRRIEGLAQGPRTLALHGSFHEAPRRMVELGLSADCVLADLGFASNQVDAAERGLSFSRNGPLDMRLDPTSPITAAELVNTLSTRELARILKEWGEERFAEAIAQKIVQERKHEPIETTARLAEITRAVAATWHGPRPSIDPATKTFQALRIAVNDELGRLDSLLESIERAARARRKLDGEGAGNAGAAQKQAGPWLSKGARIGIIAFHSLEDRPVKQAFAAMSEQGLVRSLTKKPVEAGEEERSANPRSRSAKLRACRIGT